MARVAVEELQRQGYETYEEVSMGYGSKRADIVAVRAPVIIVVETKTVFSTALVEQLMRWHNGAHYVIGCATGGINPVLNDYCRIRGYGLWSVRGLADKWSSTAPGIDETLAPKLFRTAAAHWIKKALQPEQKTGGEYAAAGSKAGAYFTPFAATSRDLVRVVKQSPGITLKAALSEIKHHYASASTARSTLPRLIRMGVIPDIRIEETRPLKLWPSQHARWLEAS